MREICGRLGDRDFVVNGRSVKGPNRKLSIEGRLVQSTRASSGQVSRLRSSSFTTGTTVPPTSDSCGQRDVSLVE
ncbi:DNA-directed RNA polymerase subunit beta' [Trichinella spiralis]|uniref:DNA-directed RNA polymerase subunit beta n=1 Tax=Trichinella spiralis TaxID=6334 RepID=A0ABR3KPC7_TRISP